MFRFKKISYSLLATLISGACLTTYAGTGFDYNANSNPQARCDNTIPFTLDADSKKIRLGYTEKVKNSNLSGAIPTASKSVAIMASHLSEQAIAGINMTTLILYHCDPALQSGIDTANGYNTQQFDYISLLPPKSTCLTFQTIKRSRGSWDEGDYGVAVPIGSVIRNKDHQLVCNISANNPGLCNFTAVCDADLVPNNIKHIDKYNGSNILVHEFGHAVMDAGLPNGTPEEQQRMKGIAFAYQHYLHSPQLCNNNTQKVYSCSNQSEMWAMATESWFHANCRWDNNVNIATPDEIKQHLPRLYTILEDTYGKQNEITPILPVGDPHCQLKNPAYEKKKQNHK